MRDALTNSRLFCFGLGFTGGAVARHFLRLGWRVAGTSRRPEEARALAAQGCEVLAFDRERPLPDPVAVLAGITHVLSTVPPDQHGDPVLDCHGGTLAGLDTLEWAGYLSTTGVYGDAAGSVVDEATPPRPQAERSMRRLAAEQAWQASGLPLHVFRLAGIYGPDRSVFDQVRAGRAKRIDRPGHLFSRIHVEDIVAVLEASMGRPDPGAVYNVCDDEPAPQAEVVAHACRLLGLAPPPLQDYDEVAPALSPMARSFWAESRRVSNAKIGRELGVRLRYPDYRAGLAAVLAAETEEGADER